MWGMIAMAGMSIASSMVSAGSQYSAAKANEEAMRREARYQEYKSLIDQKQYREQAEKAISQGNLAFSKSGIRMTSGTVQEVFRENTQTMLSDIEMIKLGGKFSVNKALMAANNYESQKTTAIISGLLGAGGGTLNAMDKGGMFDKTSSTGGPTVGRGQIGTS